MILMDKKRISAKELADMFEVSTRTIYRDIEAISIAGIPVNSTSGVGGGFEIMENYKIDKATFLEGDITTLLIGMSNLPNVIKNWGYSNTLAKIKNLIPEEKSDTIHSKSEQICIDFSHWTWNRNVELDLDIIKIALQENKLLSFEYINHKGEQTRRQVEPYQLVLKSSQWYLQSFCLMRNDYRLFKLTRILNLKANEINFIPKSYKRPFLDTAEILLKRQVTIKLRIHKSIMERVLDYCDYRSFLLDDDNHYIVNFPFIENDYHYGIILSFGTQCECLYPPQVRSKLKDKIDSLVKLYSN